MRKIAIRIDDVTRDMDWEKFHRFEEILNKNQIAPLIGIVPDNQDPMLKTKETKEDFASWVKEKKNAGWCVAMHGYRHVYETKKKGSFPLNPFSEFAGLKYRNQYEKICAGKKKLEEEGIKTNIFMAPGHSFDKNTLKALKENGFTYVTDGFGGKPYLRSDMIFLPIAFQRGKELKKKTGYTTYVVHTATMREADFAAYEKLLKEKREHFIDYSELLKIAPQKQSMFAHGTEFFMAWMKGVLCRIRK